jgi:magnesium-protoporphyrin O-methyltransferase
LRRYEERGLDRIERRMVSAATEGGVDGVSVLEIGGGIGKLQAEALLAGAARGEVVELVEAFGPYAAELARRKGIAGRTSFRVVDLLEAPEEVAEADLVFLNRVVCCSPDGVALTGVAARLTRRTLALSFPRDLAVVRMAVGIQNLAFRLLGRAFRVFVHPPGDLVAAATEAGLRLGETGRRGAWEYVVLERAE